MFYIFTISGIFSGLLQHEFPHSQERFLENFPAFAKIKLCSFGQCMNTNLLLQIRQKTEKSALTKLCEHFICSTL